MNNEALTAPALEALLRTPSLAVLALDKQGCVILWSPSASRMFGWTESEVLGRFLPIVPEEHRQGVYDRIQAELEGETFSTLDVPALRNDGSVVDVSLWSTPLRDSKGEVIGILGVHVDISGRRRAEDALQEAEAELRRVLAAVSDYIYSGEFDSDGRFFYHYYSPAVERIMERSPLFFLAGPERWLSSVHTEDRPRLEQAFSRLQSGQSASEEEEYRIVLPDGTVRWVRDSVLMSQGPAGRRFVNGVVSDITARKKTEEALQARELELRRVLSAASDYFWSGDCDPEGRFRYLYYSPAVERITGRPTDFYMPGSEQWMSTIHPEDRARLFEISERLLSGQSVSSENEHRIVLPDGTIRWVRANVTASPSADGHRRLDGVVSDITARKQAEEALRESEARFRGIFTAAASGIVLVSPEGRFLHANPAFCEFLGYSEQELASMTVQSVTHPDDRKRTAEIRRKVWEGERSLIQRYEKRYLRKDRQTVWGDVSMSLVRDAMGKANYSIAQVLDITERKRAEEELNEKEHLLSESQRIAHIGSWRWDLTGPIKWTEETYRIYGVSPEMFTPTTKSLVDLLHPEDRPAMQRWFEACRAGQSPDDLEFRAILPDGSVRLLSGRGELLYDTENRPAYMAGTVQDITARKKSEAALQEIDKRSQEQLRELEQLYKYSPVGLYVLDRDLRFLRINEQLAEIDGISVKEHLGRTISEVVPNLAEQLQKLWQPIFEGGEPVLNVEVSGTTARAPGALRHWLCNYFPMKAVTGEVIGLMAAIVEITERKRAEAALKESEERFRQVAESSGEFIWEVDVKGLYTYASPSVEEILGYAPRELVGKKYFYDLFSPSARDELKTAAFQAFADLQAFRNFSNTVVGKTGEIVYLETSGSPVLDSAGNLVGYRGADTDVTARKQWEGALRESEERYRTLAESAPEAIYIIDRDDRVQYLNSYAASMMGGTPKALTGKRRAELFPPETSEHQRREIEAVFESGRPRHIQNRTSFPGGDLWLDTHLVPLRGAGGVVQAVMGISRDVTDRKRAEEAVRESEVRYRTMVEAIPHAIWRADPQGQPVDGNSRWCEYTGQTPEETLDGGWMKAVHPEDVNVVLQETKEAITRGGPYQAEYRVRRASDGSYRWHLGRSLPITDKDGRIIGWFGSATDIDDQKRAAETLQRAHDELEKRVEQRTKELLQVNAALVEEMADRQRAEQAVRQSETKYRTLVEEIPAITYIAALDEDRTTLYVSPQLEPVLGLTPTDYRIKPDLWRQHVHPDDLDRVMAEVRRAHMSGEPLDCEYRMLHRTGEIVWIRDRAVLVSDEAGKPLFLQGVMLDVTERHQAGETMLLQSTALEAAANSIVITDREGDILWVNPAFTKLTGYGPSEVTGKNPRVLKSGQHDKAFYQNLWQTVLSGQVWHGEMVNKRKDGSLYIEQMTITPVRNAAGGIAHFIAIKQDITEWKSAEESRRHLGAIVESSDDAIISADLNGTITSWNAAAQRLYNYSAEEILGRPILILVPRDRAGEIRELRKKVRCGEHTHHFETVRLKKGGIPVDVSITVSPIRNDAGQVIGVSSITRDITERKELEQAVVEASSREQKRIGQDLHDGLCQQLTGIGFLWKAMARKEAVQTLPKAAEVAEITQLITKTIGEARDLARVLCPVELESNDLGVALKNLGLSMERLFAVSCVVRCQQPVLLADKTVATHLYRVTQEAISNAIHHGKAARVWIYLGRKKNKLTLRIRDNGSGFSKRRGFKEGIGMRSMRYRAHVIGGSLTIETKRGAGTTVACVCTQPRSRSVDMARRRTLG